jgi:serine/threonine protein kinase
MLKKLNHPSIARLSEIFYNKFDSVYLVMELYHGKNLLNFIQNRALLVKIFKNYFLFLLMMSDGVYLLLFIFFLKKNKKKKKKKKKK